MAALVRRLRLEKREFSRIRNTLGKTQIQMAQLLGTSLKAIQSFEQGWRKIPPYIERQLLFLYAKKTPSDGFSPCWQVQACPEVRRTKCPAWEFQIPSLCWFINGTICHGEVQANWSQKMELCRRCGVFQSAMDSVGRES
jgi:DNA-binding XRE family transcriptional regulator